MRIRAFVAAAFLALSIPAAAEWPAVDAAIRPFVEQGQLSGAVILVIHDGKVVHGSAIGQREIESGAPMEMDTIFRIYSMTKPVTAVAMMILHDEGKWKPEDPVAKFVPELANLKLYKGKDAAGNPILQAPETQPTMGQLMTHTAGFGYGLGFGNPDVNAFYRAGDPLTAQSGDEFARRLGVLPLGYEPGTRWEYSLSVDVQGLIVERLSGQSLADFMQQRIFEPLGMKDTGFHVPAEKRARLAAIYRAVDGKLVPAATGPWGYTYTARPGFAHGGAGLVGTAGDYARFAQMLLDDGVLDGARILKPGSAGIIMSDRLPPTLVGNLDPQPLPDIVPGARFGYNGAVVLDPVLAGQPLGKGSYRWGGALGTWFWIDPEHRLVFVGMVQSPAASSAVRERSYEAVASSLVGAQ